MAAENINVYIKSLSGDLIELEVTPKHGLKGVEEKLSLFDSDNYPLSQFRCFFIDDDVKELSQDIVLGVVAVEAPMTKLEGFREVVLATNVPYGVSDITREIIFKLSSGTNYYVYIFREYSGTIYMRPSFIRADTNEFRWQFGFTHANYVSVAMNNKSYDCYIPVQDNYVITQILLKLYPHKFNDTQFDKQPIYCECGHTINYGSLRGHLKTKTKHAKGDPKGIAFVKRVADYVATI